MKIQLKYYQNTFKIQPKSNQNATKIRPKYNENTTIILPKYNRNTTLCYTEFFEIPSSHSEWMVVTSKTWYVLILKSHYLILMRPWQFPRVPKSSQEFSKTLHIDANLCIFWRSIHYIPNGRHKWKLLNF